MNWRKWIIPGLVVTLAGAPLAVFLQNVSIERDLVGRASDAVTTAGQDWVRLSASGRDIIIAGIAPSADAAAAALRAAEAVEGVRAVADATTLLPLASPYAWSVRRAGRQVTFSGSVPSEGARVAVMAAARRALPQAEIVDHMTLARGAASSFSAATAFALGRIAGLSEGTATLTDTTLSMSGTATDAAAYAAIRGALAKDLPAAVEVGSIDVLPPAAARFVWSANVDSGSVTVAGNVPNEGVRDTLARAIKSTLPDLTLVDIVTVASGEPPGFAEAATFAIGLLPRLQRGGLTLDGLSLDIAGQAKSVADYDALFGALANGLPKGLRVASTDVMPAAVSAYLWQGDVADGKVILSGYAPSLEWRTELGAFARAAFAGASVDDRVRIAKGEPRMDWVGAVKFATGQLALLGRGTVAISGTGYTVSGEAKDSRAYSAILEGTAKTLPAGLVLKGVNVTPPRVSPYRLIAERREGRIVLVGYVPRDEDRQAVLAAARRVVGADVVDNLVFAGGAPAGFATAAVAAVRSLGRLAGGRADVVDQTVALAGTAYQEAAAADIGEKLRSALPAGFTMTSPQLIAAEPGQPVPATVCRDQLQAAAKTGRVEFDGTNPAITTDSFGTLDRAASMILRCPDLRIEVGVHSDNDGTAVTLRERTQARAEAILDYLVAAGVQRERLTAAGYGMSKPIGDNATAAGKAANRRVEFTVAVPAGG